MRPPFAAVSACDDDGEISTHVLALLVDPFGLDVVTRSYCVEVLDIVHRENAQTSADRDLDGNTLPFFTSNAVLLRAHNHVDPLGDNLELF